MDEDRGEGSEGKGEDLFEDLDRFFAPIEDVDWPEPESPEAAARPEEEDQGEGSEGEEDERTEASTPEEPEGAAEPAEPEERVEETVEEPAEETPTLDEEMAFEAVGTVDEPTGEIAEEEWASLRSELDDERAPAAEPLPTEGTLGLRWGDEEDDEEQGMPVPSGMPSVDEEPFELGEAASPGREPLSARADDARAAREAGTEDGPAAEEEPVGAEDLTVEDVSRPPEEYRDLPGPPEGEAVVMEDEDEAEGAGPGFGFDEMDEDEGAPGTGAEAPALDEVEAAAEHFAETIRRSPDEVEEDLLADLEPPGGPTGPRTVRVGVPDAMTAGPSWQEPTSEEVTLEGPSRPRAPGRDLPMAFLSGIAVAVLGLGSLAIGKPAFAVVATIIVMVAQGELYAAFSRRGYQPATALGLAFGALVMAAAYLKGEPAMLAMVALALPFTLLWFMAAPAKQRRHVVLNAALTLLPVAYVPVLAGYLLIMMRYYPSGRALLLVVAGLAVGYDIVAYAAGSVLGNRALAPTISPNKSWEGAIVPLPVLVLFSMAVLSSVHPIDTLPRALGLAIVISIAAPLGDLVESLIKRDLGVKDMGSILPGHGGVLDRIDSILFASIAAFYFLRLAF